MALSADERKLLRKIVQERADRAKKKLQGQEQEKLKAVGEVVPLSELAATDPRRGLAEEFNKLIARAEEIAEALEREWYDYTYTKLFKGVPRFSEDDAKTEKTRIVAEYRKKYEELDDLTSEALVKTVAGGLADAELAAFTAALDKVVG